MVRYLLCTVVFIFSTFVLSGEEIARDIESDIDESLFSQTSSFSTEELYLSYYYLPTESNHRGLNWWTRRELEELVTPKFMERVEPFNISRVKLYCATENFLYGARTEYSRSFSKGFSVAFSVDYRGGRDSSIESVFSNSLRPEFQLQGLFGDGSLLRVTLKMPFVERALRSSASQEAITLTGDNLYNPSWGLYDGEVRNARVSRYGVSSLDLRYERGVGGGTKMLVDLGSEYGRRMVSQIGWYDAYNPLPDHYQKMPSYLSGDSRDVVEQLWRSGDEEYTQIAWDRLCEMNQYSEGGEACYIVEDKVTRVANLGATVLFESELEGGVRIRYGGDLGFEADRSFKEVNDLLGAAYHLDQDQYIGDYAHVGNAMQNDLRNPNRQVREGERFGYDYTSRTLSLAALAGVEYRKGRVLATLSGRFGERQLMREGHYEKERFAGELSYGRSQRVTLSSSSVDLGVQYDFGNGQQLKLSGGLANLPLRHEDLFLQVECANRVIDDPKSQRIGNLELGYYFTNRDLSLRAELFYLTSRNRVEVWGGYDDQSSNYSNIVVSGIGSRSYGAELSGKYRVSRKTTFDVTLSMGDYTYDTIPTVRLYDDTDMSLISESSSVATDGCKVGNLPQVTVAAGANFNLSKGIYLSLYGSYSTGRYIEPSFVRRTERLLAAAGSSELAQEMVDQQSLGSVTDLSVTLSKIFYMSHGGRLTLYASVQNLLGESDRVEYCSESSRLVRGSGTYSTGSYYLKPDSYRYGVGRTLYFSCSYRW